MAEELMSVVRIFEAQEVPSWQNQLTVRAFAMSFGLSVLFTFIVMKLNLTTGIIPSLNVSAGFLGFFFVETWTKLLKKSGLLKQPFTRQENTVIQTCVVASSGIAFSGFNYDRHRLMNPRTRLILPILGQLSLSTPFHYNEIIVIVAYSPLSILST
ncbi:probable metal-nicotianamine transporter YSL5 [Cucumis melo]|uniref:Probable metal-nicotianamine transporter YSL5 n=1 Tax=Cucumis melo TaxID=3656 RepID=A0ABM3KJI1_CUCME|nr:probable metal-nicotianamine transporter YSL5 [Cucumis melo]